MSVKSHTIYILLDIHLCHTIKVKFLSHRYTKERFLRKPLFFLILIPTHEIINCKKILSIKLLGMFLTGVTTKFGILSLKWKSKINTAK